MPPVRFLTYFVSALQSVRSGIGAAILAALQSPQPPPVEAALTLLLNELSVIPEDSRPLFYLDGG
jgi:LuxR family transcriptional regulator, maltose regulon positive regulatory protein